LCRIGSPQGGDLLFDRCPHAAHERFGFIGGVRELGDDPVGDAVPDERRRPGSVRLGDLAGPRRGLVQYLGCSFRGEWRKPGVLGAQDAIGRQ
jgi:hypothetical protein